MARNPKCQASRDASLALLLELHATRATELHATTGVGTAGGRLLELLLEPNQLAVGSVSPLLFLLRRSKCERHAQRFCHNGSPLFLLRGGLHHAQAEAAAWPQHGHRPEGPRGHAAGGAA